MTGKSFYLGAKDIGSNINVLDNTFSGVIETSLMYTSFSHSLESIAEKVSVGISLLNPFPKFLLPEAHQFHALAKYYHGGRVPGGGIFAGYMIFGGYLVALPYLLAVKCASSCLSGALISFNDKYRDLVFLLSAALFIAIPRIMLYDPSALWRFLLLLFVLYIANSVILQSDQ
jgi:hypothetical protein